MLAVLSRPVEPAATPRLETAVLGGALSREAAPFTPCLRLFTQPLLVDQGGLFQPELEEVQAPALQLRFDYGGRLFALADAAGEARDRAAEARACFLLESLGAVDLACLEHYEAIGAEADFIIAPDGDVHTICAFAAYAVPQLRGLGWRVEVDPGYRWQVIATSAPWYGDLSQGGAEDDWFSLELGVEVDGHRVNLLPALLGLLEGSHSLRGLRGASRRRCLAVPVDGQRYLALPPERVDALVEVLQELYGEGRVQGGSLQLPVEGAAQVAALDELFSRDRGGGLSWGGSRETHDLALVAAKPAPATPPPGLRADLRAYQREGLAWLQHVHGLGAGGILADDMGLGKTLQTIAHLLAEVESGRATQPSLIVSPTSLVSNWQRELARFAPSLKVLVLSGPRRRERLPELASHHVAVTSYPLLSRDFDLLLRQRFHVLVLDEAQAIKTSTSQTHRAARALLADHRLCLSGTPMENNLGELWALFDFLMPGFLGEAARFREHFRLPIERGGEASRLETLRRRVCPFILRRTKDEVLSELPPKTEIVRPVELRGAQRELYEAIRVSAHAEVRHAIQSKGIARSTIAILDALMKLRQVCCDPRLVKMTAARKVEDSAKLATLLELLAQQRREGRRVLIFSQFTSMLALIEKALDERGWRWLSLTGATRDRQGRIDAFDAGEADLFLISLKAGGTGLNLTRADTVIHYDPWWNPAVQAQATDRAHRFGQTRPVFVYSLIVAGSVEERMLRLQQRKRELAQSVLAGAGAGPAALSEREVDDLFGPLEDEG